MPDYPLQLQQDNAVGALCSVVSFLLDHPPQNSILYYPITKHFKNFHFVNKYIINGIVIKICG